MKKIKFNEDLIRIIISIVFLVLGMIFNENIYLLVISYVFVSKEVYFNALKNIKNGKIFDENFLMIIATLGAFYIKEYPEAVLVMLLFSIGEYLSDLAVDNSKKAIVELMDLRSDKVNIKDKGYIDVKESKVGDIFIVAPGEKIPLDGIIVNGTSHIDTKSLTGESVPRKVNLNDTVLSGTINLDSVLEIKATKTFETSTASKIIEIIENSEEKKTKTEKFITRFSKIYTPIVVILAILVVIVPVSLEKNFTTWVYRALEMLVISCPCALVISVPLSYFTSIGKSSKEKILVKGSDVMDNLNKIDTIIFDKTGTITKGVFEVIKIKNINYSKEELLYLVASAEAHSNHPIAKSIIKIFDIKTNNNYVKDFEEVSGKGIMYKLNNDDIKIGSSSFCGENKKDNYIYLSLNNKIIARLQLLDGIKKDAKKTIEQLDKMKINTKMFTGDNKEIATMISKKVGINDVYYELLPDDKYNLLQENIKTGKTVAFVGDGINDAPSLALSNIGISMGGIGSASAIEASDVVIMTDELSKIVDGIKISKKTNKIIKQNLIFAISVKVIVLILSTIGIATMWQAVFADTGVTLLTILNTTRILKK